MKTDRMQMGKKESVREAVRKSYAQIAQKGESCAPGVASRGEVTGCGTEKSCCGSGDVMGIAKAIGYTDAELATLPEGANMGLSCGNPTALAALKPGEVVLDLGSGGGFDVFLAAQKVGPKGRAIGVDMTPEMLSKARKNAALFRTRMGLDNVEFRLGEIEHLPVADASVDAIISNCVINLSPDKPQVWREMARVLKPGGRVAVSDLALLQPLPSGVLESVTALVSCIAGAVLVDETRAMAQAAGFVNIDLVSKAGYVKNMLDWNDPLYQGLRDQLPKGTKLSDYITSLYVTARK